MTARDIVMSSAGNAGDSKTYIEDVFSTYLYTGNGSTQTINNGIDLAGKGGMVWVKSRVTADFPENNVFDTARGNQSLLFTNTTDSAVTGNLNFTFNSDGFSNTPSSNIRINQNLKAYASWTFRKAPKFFDVVTYTGNGVAGRTISHSLGTTPGMIFVKCTSTAESWSVWHRSINSNTGNGYLFLDSIYTGGLDGHNIWGNGTVYIAPTSSTFSVNNISFVNSSGKTYVAYLFAHDTTTDGLIQCGSYTGNGSATGPSVTLGWEPQYLMIKNASGIGNWQIIDSMRGMPVGSADATLQANLTNAESSVEYVSPTATGFQVTSTSSEVNTSDSTYIYMAIRRGPMRTPTDGTKVFKPLARTGNNTTTSLSGFGFPPDALLTRSRDGTIKSAFFNKLTGPTQFLNTTTTDSETTSSNMVLSFNNDGVTIGADEWDSINGGTTRNYITHYFRRAPGFFDVVCYTGTGVARTVNHNLGVAPELMIVKVRSNAYSWSVYSQPTGNTKYLWLEATDAATVDNEYWNNTSPTSSVFTVGGTARTNQSSKPYVAYLFASCPGVSKVGSYTGNGSSQTINCGFSAGARFVLIKRTSSTGGWYVWDTARGIVAANDPHLSLNTIAAEVTTNDTIDPDSTGFIVNQVAATNVNISGNSYIYLAIA